MTCSTCLKKWTQFYREKGFSEEQAEFMAQKLMFRIAKRQKKERNKQLYRLARGFFFRWAFLTNFKATIFNSFHARRLLWIGKTYNPDYTQACAGTGGTATCVSDPSDPCPPVGGNCIYSCVGGTCGCPAPLANSSQVANNCVKLYVGICTCGPTGVCRRTGAVCNCTNTCGYNCDVGFVWNGVACVGSTVLLLKRMHVGL